MNPLARRLFEAGLIQFGLFRDNGVEMPFAARLDMLPSYPDLLQDVSGTLAPMIPPADHILSTPEAVPLGVALSLATGIPLVYSRGRGEVPAHDLVGAYDIGHPAVLLTTVYRDDESVRHLVATARRVGLSAEHVVAVLDASAGAGDLPVSSLVTLGDLVNALADSGLLPAGFVAAVMGSQDGQ